VSIIATQAVGALIQATFGNVRLRTSLDRLIVKSEMAGFFSAVGFTKADRLPAAAHRIGLSRSVLETKNSEPTRIKPHT
jgi:hypothetical protein